MKKTSLRDFTSGSPTKILLKFSLPMLIGNLFQQLYNMVDSIVVGKFVDSNALAAVGATSSTVFLMFGLSFGLSAGISIIVSQYYGAKEYHNVKKAFATATYVTVAAALLMGFVGFFSSRAILELLNTDPAIIDQSEIYMKICFAGIIGTAFYNGISGILRALGDAITPLIFLIIASILNVILDLIFVIELDWGVSGVAIATIISQLVAGIGCVVYAMARIKLLRMPLKEFKPDRGILKKCIRLGIPVALQNSFISISLMGLQAVINGFNVAVVAAYTASNRIEQLVLQPGMSLGAALSAYTGQNMGAGKIDRVKKGFRSASIIITVFTLIMVPLMYIGGEAIMKLFTKKEEVDVIRMGVEAIQVTSLFYLFVGFILLTRNFLSGAGDINVPMIMGFVEVICRILLANVLGHYFGYQGIWWATGLNWLLTSLVGISRVISGKWKNKSIIAHS